MNRRGFLHTLTGGLAALAAAEAASAQASANGWSFVHFTDTHIQPELRAEEGCRAAFRKISALKPDFAISGGDLIFDALGTDRKRADLQFGMYKETIKLLEMPLYNTMGNHDVFGLYTKSGVAPTEPKYGKLLYEDYIGKRYHSFNHKGWHFIVLDSIGMTPERQYIGHIDDEQLTWLKNDLESTGTSTPIVVVTHIALTTSFPFMVNAPGASTAGVVITNTREVMALLAPYKVKAVLQGHTHIIENVRYKDTQFITSGAVSGNWWKGQRFGFDEGFAVLTVQGDEIHWRYETYGWKAA
ncbi:MAG: metallophosphoesterase [Bryobacterales bacterium]|jgi:3',5'-cyclic AMP phosphodiesterase CpdA|nr:metallophosphoesterase [Bryobacterales bacterium]